MKSTKKPKPKPLPSPLEGEIEEPVGRPTGRPSGYTKRDRRWDLRKAHHGELLIKICQDDDMPPRGTVYTWMTANPSFKEAFAREIGLGRLVGGEGSVHLAGFRRGIFSLMRLARRLSTTRTCSAVGFRQTLSNG